MATVNKHALREEFERLKAEFGRLSAAGAMSAETRTLINALLMLLEAPMAIFMEKTTGKGSRNSSIPPSQTSKDETAATRPGGKGKGVTQNDARSRHSRTVTTTEVAAIDELLRLPALHADETSLRVDRKNHWIHVYSGGEVTVKRLHRKRGCEAIDDIGIIPRYGGVVVHDCWAS